MQYTEDSAIYGTYRRACELRKPPKVAKTLALLLGDSGVGKSSLINAVLGIPGLAKVVALGTSVTTVATSYESPLHGQTKTYGIQIDYLSEHEVRCLIKDFINDYKTSTDDSAEFEPDDLNRVKKAGTTAFEALSHLFYGDADLESKDALSRLLAARQSRLDELVSKLADKVEEMIRQLVMAGYRSTPCIQSDELKSVQQEAASFTSFTPGQMESTPYPLIKQVRMGISDQNLLKDFSIVDCPGKSDINMIHARAYHRQLEDCNELWIVDRADRIETHGPVADYTRHYGSSSKNVVVIGTRADDDIGNGDALLEHLQQRNVDVSHIHQLRKRRQELETIRAQANKDFEKVKKHERSGKKRKRTSSCPEDNDMVNRAESSLLRAKANSEKADSAILTALVEARSMHVTRRLRERFQGNLPLGKKLEIFFVSNTQYESNASADGSGAFLSVEATNIPALRQYVHSRAAPKILEALETYISTQYVPFIHGIGIFVDPVKLQGSQQAVELVNAKQQHLPQICDAYIEDLASKTQSVLAEPLRAARPAHIVHALQVLECKKKWHLGTIKVWVQGNGYNWTKRKAPENWNDLFASESTKMVDELWKEFVVEENTATDGLFGTVIGTVRAVARELKQSRLGQVVQFERFSKFVDGQISGLEATRHRFKREIGEALDTVHSRANTDSSEGYFRKGLLDAYERCKQMSGTGVKVRIMTTLENFFSLQNEGSPFSVMAAEICKGIREGAHEQTEELMDAAGRIFDDMRAELETMLEERQEDQQQVTLRMQLQKWLTTSEKIFNYNRDTLEDIKLSYDDIKQEERAGEEGVAMADAV
ncbi:hypothetical protein Tdes44962_MAKER07079 [Teratosphaeria destructans]|uniref:DUF7605 domain-containing protein n=1 Tax=Teratosphaeria destructans TaxID=418781 RepID=A0A9W7T0R3_9PEZI|nr:hypothetical protein Tdes44962_MAKER07079 [Teratosphaeria destructans]